VFSELTVKAEVPVELDDEEEEELLLEEELVVVVPPGVNW
jgi:hypothetical protein